MRVRNIGVLAVLAMFAMACELATTSPAPSGSTSDGPEASATAGSAASAPPSSEELRIAVASFGNEALDPIKGPNNNGRYLRLMFDELVGVNPSGTEISKETGIARDWTVSSDGLTYTFLLRDDVTFHNGDELTAEDVKFSLDRLQGPDVLTTFGGQIAGQIADVAVTGLLEVQVRLTAPNLGFLLLLSPLSDISGMVVPKAYFEEVGPDGFAENPIGSGPYRLVDRAVGSSMTFEKAFPQHFAVGAPPFERVSMRLVPEESTRLALLRTGDADFVDVGTEQAPSLQDEGFQLFEHLNKAELMVMFQLQRPEEPTNDINLRKALSYAIDRQSINDNLVGGFGELRANIWPAQIGGETIPVDPFDLDQAKAFLNMTPYGEGGEPLNLQLQVPIRDGWPQLLQIAEAVQSYWSELGVDSTIIYRDYGTFRGELNAGTLPAPAAMLFNVVGRVDNSGQNGSFWGCEGVIRVVCDPVLDERFAEWRTTADEEESARLARETESYIVDNYIGIGILARGEFYSGNDTIRPDFSPGYIPLDFNIRGLVTGG